VLREAGRAMSGGGPEWTGEQLRAIERREGELLLDAAAGSGKTSVLVERFVAAVLQDGLDVGRILTITFTEKAAAEMRERIRARLRELGAVEEARATEAAFISTIHSFCARVLRAGALAAGIDPAFTVLDEPQAARLARRSFDEALERFAREVAGAEWLVGAYGIPDLRLATESAHRRLRSRGQLRPRLPTPAPPPELAPVRERVVEMAGRALRELGAVRDPSPRVLDAIERLERARALAARPVPWPGAVAALRLPGGNGAALQTPACLAYGEALAALRDGCAHHLAVEAHALLGALLEAFSRRYEERKRELGALDFADLELRCHQLLRSDRELRERYRERFERVMVDELQDTNPVQMELIETVSRGNLFTVGDAQQSIYLFRGADVELFERRGQRLAGEGARATLRVNFRSRPEILGVVNRTFGPLLGAGFGELLPGRLEPPQEEPRVELLIVDRGGQAEPDDRPVSWRAAEAEMLARRVRELVRAGAAPGGIVVLTRASTDMRTYEQALERHGVPTYLVGGRGYWSHPQVVDIVAYLRVLANPRDEQALYAVLASPLVGVSYDALVLLGAAAREASLTPWALLAGAVGGGGELLAPELGAEERERMVSFAKWVAGERLLAPRRGVQELVERALEHTGYDLAVLALPGGQRRLANVRKLMRLGREHGAQSGPDLRGFLDLVAERSQTGAAGGGEAESEAPVESESLDAVRLMTIHRAKGLEFPIVCVADLGRAPRRGGEILRLGADGRVGLRLARPGTGSREAALDYEALGEEQRAAEDGEERRIFYVAATRARERLIFSGTADVEAVWGGRPGAAPIGWLGPALVPELPAEARTGVVQGVRFAIVSPEGEEGDASPGAEEGDASPGVEEGDASPGAVPARRPAPAPALGVEDPPITPLAWSPGSLSYTALSQHARCGYRFYAERVLGLAPPAGDAGVAGAGGGGRAGALGGAERGTLVHALLERLDFRRPVAPSAKAVRAAAGRPVGARERDEIAALIERFTRGELCARLARARSVRREQPFGFLLGETLITGVLDVLAREPGGRALVVDYKTDRLDGAEPAELVAAAYATQRLIYALAVLRDGAERVEVAHVLLERPDAPVVADFSRADVPGLEARLGEPVRRVARGEFPVAAAPHRALCAGCPAEGGLCSWPLSMTRRPSAEGPAVAS